MNIPNKHHRKSIRLKEYDYSFPGWYYVTICTYEKKKLFGKVINNQLMLNNSSKIVEEEWLNTKQIRTNVDLDYYVIMPNHLHGIIIINCRGELNSPEREDPGRMQYTPTNDKFKSPSHKLGATVRGFKSSVTKRLRGINVNSELIIWQRNYYEHIIRNEIDLYNIRKYIENNPLKWELDDYYKL